MRLWHEKLIHRLPSAQLLGQHRECCALRGLGWGKPHSVVNYVFEYPYYRLYLYHMKIMTEMIGRGYNVDPLWFIIAYMGKRAGYDYTVFTNCSICMYDPMQMIYPEHDDAYYQECIENLRNKGIEIV